MIINIINIIITSIGGWGAVGGGDVWEGARPELEDNDW